jgi:Tfp pilus assembly protein PilN
MRELEFLPSWYPQLRSRRKMVGIQLWATLVMGLCLMAWVALTNRTVAQKQVQSHTLDRQLQQSRSDLMQLNEMLAEKKTLETEQQIMAKVGTHVEVSRLLAKLDQIMPKEMSLTQANFDTQEQVKDSDPNSKSGAKTPGGEKTRVVTRKLVVHLTGVTPSDADWATVLAKLGGIPFFQDVQLENAHDKSESGHLLREFEVSFAVDLGDGQ